METQAEREKKMTWQEIRDESIGRIKETYDAVTSGYIEKEIQELQNQNTEDSKQQLIVANAKVDALNSSFYEKI